MEAARKPVLEQVFGLGKRFLVVYENESGKGYDAWVYVWDPKGFMGRCLGLRFWGALPGKTAWEPQYSIGDFDLATTTEMTRVLRKELPPRA